MGLRVGRGSKGDGIHGRVENIGGGPSDNTRRSKGKSLGGQQAGGSLNREPCSTGE